MKSILIAITFATLISGFALANKIAGVRGEILTEESARKKWGESPYTSAAFKAGTQEDRAKMAASLISQKTTFKGLDRSEIRKLLGDYSGFYISGMYPTYLIQETSETSKEAWQILFLIDAKGKVTDVVIHKNCCDT
jgi:hypothetical protein